MKIVSYHWEEIKGPLREQKASADTPVLHLSNLVVGNYTFRYTCMDDFLLSFRHFCGVSWMGVFLVLVHTSLMNFILLLYALCLHLMGTSFIL